MLNLFFQITLYLLSICFFCFFQYASVATYSCTKKTNGWTYDNTSVIILGWNIKTFPDYQCKTIYWRTFMNVYSLAKKYKHSKRFPVSSIFNITGTAFLFMEVFVSLCKFFNGAISFAFGMHNEKYNETRFSYGTII